MIVVSNNKYDYLIVGAGVFGSVCAHELTKQGKRCLVIDSRNHIGGNCYTENINDIHYLQTIPVYLDTIIRLTQNKNSTSYPVNEITRLCSTGEKDEVVIEDIISPSEKSIDDDEKWDL